MTDDSTIGGVAPLLHPIPAVQERLGLGRSKIYELLGTGVLEAVKVGRRTAVTEASLARFVAGLPRAQFRAPPRAHGTRAIKPPGGRRGGR